MLDIPQTTAAVSMLETARRMMVLSSHTAAAKVALHSLALISDASVGGDGRIVRVGASTMYVIGHVTCFSRGGLANGLILASGGAEIGAAFNA